MNTIQIKDHLSVEYFPYICRFCLVKANPKNPHHPLFVQQQGQYGRLVRNESQSLLEIINSCLSIKIEPDDGLPLNICSTCEKLVTKLNNFRRHCISSAEKLNTIKILTSHRTSNIINSQPRNADRVSISIEDNRNDKGADDDVGNQSDDVAGDSADIAEMLDCNDFGLVDVDLKFVYDSDIVNSTTVTQTEPCPSTSTASKAPEKLSAHRPRTPDKIQRSAASSSDSDDYSNPTQNQNTSDEDDPDNADEGNSSYEQRPATELYKRLALQEAKMQKLMEVLSHRVFPPDEIEGIIQIDPSIQLPRLPITEVQEFARLNIRMADQAVMDQMVARLKVHERSGSLNVKVKHLMETLVDYKVTVLYSWSGRNELLDQYQTKLAFSEMTEIHSLILQCLQYRSKVTISPNLTIRAIKDYVLRAKARLNDMDPTAKANVDKTRQPFQTWRKLETEMQIYRETVAPTPFEWTNASTPGSRLIYTPHDKQLYQLKSMSRLGARYVCYVRGCRAAMNWIKEGDQVWKPVNWQQNPHLHDDQERTRHQLQFIHDLNKNVMEMSDRTPSEIFRSMLTGDAHDAAKTKYFRSRREHFEKLARERDQGVAVIRSRRGAKRNAE